MHLYGKPANRLHFTPATANGFPAKLCFRNGSWLANKRAALVVAATFLFVLFVGWRLRTDAAATGDEGFLDTAAKWEAHRQARQAVSQPWRALQPQNNRSQSKNERVLVLYVYKHDDWRLQNLAFFLRHGLATHTSQGMPIDYVFIVNGADKEVRSVLSDMRLTYAYVDTTSASGSERVPHEGGKGGRQAPLILVHRENTGYEFCAIKEVIEAGHIPHPHQYKYVITMNGSVRGPFLPPSFSGVWPDIFLPQLGPRSVSTGQGGEQQVHVGLMGTTLNCMTGTMDTERRQRQLHLQSMFLAWTSEALLASSWVFECLTDMQEVIRHCELGTTQAVLTGGYAIMSLQQSMAGYVIKDLDDPELWRRCAAVDRERGGGDPYYDKVYMGGNLHPYELVFIKTNRHIDDEAIQRLTRLHDTFPRVA